MHSRFSSFTTMTSILAYSALHVLSSRSILCRGFTVLHPMKAFSATLERNSYDADISSRFSFYSNMAASKDDDNSDDEFEPTWTHTPYKPPPPPSNRQRPPQRRFFSSNDNWTVPKTISIPEDKLEFTFTRSSGAGGQNVNKVNTQVVIRFHVMEATWIPFEVRQRIVQNEPNRINKDGSMIINSQEYRTQLQNRKDALDKLQDIILKHYPRPKVRKIRNGISKKAKAINKEDKRRSSAVKNNRKSVEF